MKEKFSTNLSSIADDNVICFMCSTSSHFLPQNKKYKRITTHEIKKKHQTQACTFHVLSAIEKNMNATITKHHVLHMNN